MKAPTAVAVSAIVLATAAPAYAPEPGAPTAHWAKAGTVKAERLVNRYHRYRRWARSYRGKWQIRYHRLPAHGKSWAVSTGACESGNDPTTNTGNGYLGAFQWVLSTWYAAGGDRYPTLASWHHQAVLAWDWHLGHPSGQWPVCGE